MLTCFVLASYHRLVAKTALSPTLSAPDYYRRTSPQINQNGAQRMILINTSSLQLRCVSEPQQTPYAILSHTWGEDEVSYIDFSNLEEARSKSGYDKIVKTCQLAKSRGLRYVWIDTCCIDKSSSAELTEAINSMFRWYKEAQVCFAYISDLPQQQEGGPISDWLENSHYRWFTRGWTLQELIAADKVEFYDSDWSYRGDKATMISQLNRVTGIDEQALSDSNTLPAIPVARKMSWAADRQTTRTEDMAYCLLGLFDISMPMIYGEGERAFIRLQEEIAKETNDLSLFAWTSPGEYDLEEFTGSPGEYNSEEFTGIFASSPAEFAGCGDVVRLADFLVPRPEFAITNHVVRLEASLEPENNQFVLDLGCFRQTVRDPRLGIYLFQAGSEFVRQHSGRLYTTIHPEDWNGSKSTVYVRKRLSPDEKERMRSRIYVRFQDNESTSDYGTHGMTTYPKSLWASQGGYFLTMESNTPQAAESSTIYPHFLGIIGFDIFESNRNRVCRCLLVCGIFEDLQGNDRPCAVLYTDAEPIYLDISSALRKDKGEVTGGFLSTIRDYVISKHSPNEETLSWSDVSNREIQVAQLSIRLTISLTKGLTPGGDVLSPADPSDIERTDEDDRGQDIASLPANFSGERQYVLLIHLGRA